MLHIIVHVPADLHRLSVDRDIENSFICDLKSMLCFSEVLRAYREQPRSPARTVSKINLFKTGLKLYFSKNLPEDSRSIGPSPE